jgi:hypothetical protein
MEMLKLVKVFLNDLEDLINTDVQLSKDDIEKIDKRLDSIKKKDNRWKYWSKKDISILIYLRDKNVSISYMAEFFHRSEGAIRCQIGKLAR